MTLGALVARGCRAHAKLCTDTVTASRGAGSGAFNPTTGTYGGTDATVYEGAARLKRAMSGDVVAGDREVQAGRLTLVLPHGADGAADLRPGDLVTWTDSLDPTLVGAVVTVVGVDVGSTATAHRYTVEQVTP